MPTFIPLYRQILADLTHLIDGGPLPPGTQPPPILTSLAEDGRLLPGTQLPSTRKLAEEYGVSRNTVREAIGRLLDAGLLTGHQGLGVYVAEPPSNRPDRR